MTRQEKFIKDLEHLLFLYDADLRVMYDDHNFPICTITMDAQYDDDKEIVEDFCEFELPEIMTGKKLTQYSPNFAGTYTQLKVTK